MLRIEKVCHLPVYCGSLYCLGVERRSEELSVCLVGKLPPEGGEFRTRNENGETGEELGRIGTVSFDEYLGLWRAERVSSFYIVIY